MLTFRPIFKDRAYVWTLTKHTYTSTLPHPSSYFPTRRCVHGTHDKAGIVGYIQIHTVYMPSCVANRIITYLLICADSRLMQCFVFYFSVYISLIRPLSLNSVGNLLLQSLQCCREIGDPSFNSTSGRPIDFQNEASRRPTNFDASCDCSYRLVTNKFRDKLTVPCVCIIIIEKQLYFSYFTNRFI